MVKKCAVTKVKVPKLWRAYYTVRKTVSYTLATACRVSSNNIHRYSCYNRKEDSDSIWVYI